MKQEQDILQNILDDITILQAEIIQMVQRREVNTGKFKTKMLELDALFNKAYSNTKDPFFKAGTIWMHTHCQKWLALLELKK